eukprot:CAMPEP_0182902468 /NCGR_PEP_ID=MMETSP0034_2-20130328/30494_1 /TAXON_ID=156128 /ORGANISM="Nephroselmis pyriformis, Strain CCMP717" /LENGTH=71 /DNA_ID=CAMNT_0025037139 /DNA_START=204 /DNA_END=417 /DNA_ORIENTATION=-
MVPISTPSRVPLKVPGLVFLKWRPFPPPSASPLKVELVVLEQGVGGSKAALVVHVGEAAAALPPPLPRAPR